MSWTIQSPPNPIVLNDDGNQVSGTSIAWKDKNNSVITSESVIAQPEAETWVSSQGVELIEGAEVVTMVSYLWNNDTVALTWDGQNYSDSFSSDKYNDIGVVFETSWS